MLSKKIVLPLFLSIITHSLHGMFHYLEYGQLQFHLFNTRSPISPLFEALYEHDSQKIKQLIEQGADVNEKDNTDIPFLWQLIDRERYFSEQDIIEIIDLLIKKSVNVNFTVGLSQHTVLHKIISCKSNVLLLQKCVQAGASVDTKDKAGNTPLHRAAAKNKKQFTQLLLSCNADYQIKNNNGQTAYNCTKNDEIKTMLRSKMLIDNSITYIRNPQLCELGLHIILRFYPKKSKELEYKL